MFITKVDDKLQEWRRPNSSGAFVSWLATADWNTSWWVAVGFVSMVNILNGISIFKLFKFCTFVEQTSTNESLKNKTKCQSCVLKHIVRNVEQATTFLTLGVFPAGLSLSLKMNVTLDSWVKTFDLCPWSRLSRRASSSVLCGDVSFFILLVDIKSYTAKLFPWSCCQTFLILLFVSHLFLLVIFLWGEKKYTHTHTLPFLIWIASS